MSLWDGCGAAVQSDWAMGLADLSEVVGEDTLSVFCLVGEERWAWSSAGGGWGVPPLETLWSFWVLSAVVLSLTGPRTLLATIAS